MAKIVICAQIDLDPAQREEALAAHFVGQAYAGMRDHIGTFSLTGAVSRKYRVDAEGAVYNTEGIATETFD